MLDSIKKFNHINPIDLMYAFIIFVIIDCQVPSISLVVLYLEFINFQIQKGVGSYHLKSYQN